MFSRPVHAPVHARTALLLALASGALAVGVVAVDLTYTLTARLETREGAGWRVLSVAPAQEYERFPVTGDCGSPDLRLVVDNHRPIGATVRVVISYASAPGETAEEVDEVWDLGAFEVRDHAFTIPGSAFNSTSSDPSGRPVKAVPNVSAQVGDDLYLYGSCIEREA